MNLSTKINAFQSGNLKEIFIKKKKRKKKKKKGNVLSRQVKYGCGILAETINTGLKFVSFRLKNTDLVA